MINNGATFIKRSIDFKFNTTSFDYKNPKPATIELINILDDIPIKATSIFILVNNDKIKVNLNNYSATVCDELIDLNAGTWNITVIFDGDDNYALHNDTLIITIFPGISSLTIDNVNTTVGHELTLTVNVFSSNNLTINEGMVTFIDGETEIGEVNVIDGVATLTYIPNIDGEHNIIAVFTSNNYQGSNNTSKLLVDSANVEVLVDEGTVGFNSTFVVNVKGLYSVINEGSVSFFIDEEYLGKVPVVDGFARFTYMPLVANSYIVKVIYGDSSNFFDDEDSVNYIVNKADSHIIIGDFVGTVGHELTLTVNVFSSNNFTINEGHVIFFVNNTKIGEVNVIDGVASLEYTSATAGNFYVSAIFNNSANYLKSNDSSKIKINKANVEIYIESKGDVCYSVPSEFTVKILSNSKNVNEGIVKFYINDAEIGFANVTDGVATFEYTYLNVGTFNLNAIFEESENYLANCSQSSLTIEKMPTKIVCESQTIGENDEKIISIKLVDLNGKGVINETVELILAKSTGELVLLSNISNSEGIVTYSAIDLSGGVWSMFYNHKESENYLASSDNNKIVLIKIKTSTVINMIDNVLVDNVVKLSSDIYDEFGNIIKVGIAHLFINDEIIGEFDWDKYTVTNYLTNKTIDVSRDSNLFIEYTPTVKGIYSLKISYYENGLYQSSNQTLSFEANLVTKIISSSVNTVYKEGKYLVVTLKDTYGNILTNEKITIKVESISKTLTTNAKGQVSVLVSTLTPKVYVASITFAGNNFYAKSLAKVDVVVKKATLKLTAKAKTFKKSVKVKKYAVTLKDNTGKSMKNVKLTLKIKNKKFTAKTNAKGKATFKLKKFTKKGNFKATITYNGNAYYNKAVKKVKIRVK